MKYDELYIETCGLHECLQDVMSELVTYEKKFKKNYRGKYIDLLFNFYNSYDSFSEMPSEEHIIEGGYDPSKKELENLKKYFNKFIEAFKNLIYFCDFANVKLSNGVLSVFNYWKEIWFDLKE